MKPCWIPQLYTYWTSYLTSRVVWSVRTLNELLESVLKEMCVFEVWTKAYDFLNKSLPNASSFHTATQRIIPRRQTKYVHFARARIEQTPVLLLLLSTIVQSAGLLFVMSQGVTMQIEVQLYQLYQEALSVKPYIKNRYNQYNLPLTSQ